MSLTANGKATLTTATPQEEITIRRATLLDGPDVGKAAATAYFSTLLTSWISPRREKYPAAYQRGFFERAVTRILSPRNETYVACLSSAEGKVVGAAQFVRLGDDAGARKMIRDVGLVRRVLLWVLCWGFWAWCQVWWLFHGGDKSVDREAVETFAAWCRVDQGRFWEGREERVNRWHAQSVVVLPEWQGRGIGKRLMAEVLRRAERDGVMVGLESSVKGEGLYRRLGFELLGRFTTQADAMEGGDKGGVMAWYPEGWKERHSGES
jgi:ribosomal protein S18 acetylase RimI-like enzyme